MSVFSAEPFDAEVYSRLYGDLTEASPRVAPFFPRPAGDVGAWAARAAEVHASWRGAEGEARRAALVAALRRRHEAWGLRPAQERCLAALSRQDALVVVAGQQPGLFTGPLFTLYKALGAVIRAEAATRVLGCPVVPVFWVASEDHDWSELAHLSLPGPDGRAVHLSLPGDGGHRSAGHIPVPAETRHLVSELTTFFPPAEAGAQIARALWDDLRSPRLTVAEWFCRQMQRLLGDTGLLLYDPMQPELRRLAAPVFAGAARRAARVNERLVEAAQAMETAGYAPGLHPESDAVHLFVYHRGLRIALHAEADRLQTRDGQVQTTAAEVAAEAVRAPEGFSANVVLRPVVQDATLPVLCQLAGPGEVAYLAQVARVFEAWDRPAPLVGPRPGATLLEAEDAAVLSEAGLSVRDLWEGIDAAIDRVLAVRATVDLDALFKRGRAAMADVYARFDDELAAVAPTLGAVVQGNAERVNSQLAYLERKARQHRRRAERAWVNRMRATAGRLIPDGGLQERRSGVYPYAFRRGPRLIPELREALAGAPGPFGRHWVLTERCGDVEPVTSNAARGVPAG